MAAAVEDRDRWLRRIPDRPLVPALLALLLAVLFAGALLVRWDGDPSQLVHAGPPWTTADGAPGSLTLRPDGDAFDGQFFYRIGTAPWSTATRVDGVRFDLPALRNARWGYGALAFVASGGDRDLVPWALLGLNVAAATIIGGLGGALARSSGRHAAWGLLLALWPGFAYSLSLDTSELVASAFVLGGLLAARRGRWGLTAALLLDAVIVRDTTAVVPFGLAVAGLWLLFRTPRLRVRTAGATSAPARADTDTELRRPFLPVVAGAWPLLGFGVWQLVQRARFGDLPLSQSGDNNLTRPLAGLVHELGRVVPPSGGEEAYRLLAIVVVVGLLAAAGVALAQRTSGAPFHERVTWAPAAAVVLFLNAYLWSGATAFLRASTEAGLLSILVLLGSKRRWTDWVALPVAGLWALSVVAQLGKAG